MVLVVLNYKPLTTLNHSNSTYTTRYKPWYAVVFTLRNKLIAQSLSNITKLRHLKMNLEPSL